MLIFSIVCCFCSICLLLMRLMVHCIHLAKIIVRYWNGKKVDKKKFVLPFIHFISHFIVLLNRWPPHHFQKPYKYVDRHFMTNHKICGNIFDDVLPKIKSNLNFRLKVESDVRYMRCFVFISIKWPTNRNIVYFASLLDAHVYFVYIHFDVCSVRSVLNRLEINTSWWFWDFFKKPTKM